jgi:glycosyltransferase involved in cell wall biosynthesis
MSIYLIALERRLDRKSKPAVQLLRGLEWLACRLPDRLILDTAAYVAWFRQVHGVDPARFRLVPTGADSDQFASASSPQSALPVDDPSPTSCRVIYYGTYIPNHGVPTMIEAAQLMADDERIHFVFIGRGPERAAVERLVEEYQLTNLTLIDWLSQDELVQQIATADIILGAFGTTPQSLMTVQNKIYEGLAMGKAVLSGDAPAVRQALVAGEEIDLCARADGAALAKAIRHLAADPLLRAALAEAGQRRFLHDYAIAPLGERFRAHLQEVVAAP